MTQYMEISVKENVNSERATITPPNKTKTNKMKTENNFLKQQQQQTLGIKHSRNLEHYARTKTKKIDLEEEES